MMTSNNSNDISSNDSTSFYGATRSAFEELRRDREILLVDQRGTGSSAALDCAVDEDAVQGQATIEQTLEVARLCLDSLPFDPRFFTTSIAVRDLEAVLGYEPLYGIFYGIRVLSGTREIT